ncbi:MAG: hypothetical protein E7415_02815 [Ruminococcaceae bacterium]|nr:hypothetical protein [Oscillospiraceae bacterium]
MKYALIGEKLSHSFSKIIHEAIGKYEYDLVSVPQGNLKDFVINNKYAGFNVTIPYKKDIMEFCDYISPSAKKIGCVNTVKKVDGKLFGYNTDYDGFDAMARKSNISFCGKKVAILGSGGTSLTVKAVVSDCGAEDIKFVSRSGKFNYENINEWKDCQIIVNTTPVGMFPCSGETPVNISDFPQCEGVLDVVYNPLTTKLVFDATQKGISSSNGLYMLVYQAKRAFEIFTDDTLSNDITNKIYVDLYKQMSNIILVGMPGCGKSTLGKKIAELTGKEFLDTDEEIVKAADMTIPEIFEKHGEAFFRQTESEIARKVGCLSGKVIATGGGIVLNKDNLYPLKQNGTIYYITRDISRLETAGRPLSKDLDTLKSIEIFRKPMYEKFADEIIDNNDNIETTVSKIINYQNITI